MQITALQTPTDLWNAGSGSDYEYYNSTFIVRSIKYYFNIRSKMMGIKWNYHFDSNVQNISTNMASMLADNFFYS